MIKYAHLMVLEWILALYTVDLVIFACLHFLILGLFTKFRVGEFSCSFSSAIIIIIFARFFNSRICPPREIREN